uniref:Outer dense fiber of sperm tails 3 n=1 Tax=Falco tinnunculus TaxID=100819 RepID=A0A8C4TNJ9_FALTI
MVQAEEAWVGTWRPHRPRSFISAQFTTPAPKYSIPGTTGYLAHSPTKVRAPAYTFPTAKRPVASSCSPGPRYYVPPAITSPCYSMKGKSKHYSYLEDVPKVTLTKPQAPAPTFGLRHSRYTTPLILPL